MKVDEQSGSAAPASGSAEGEENGSGSVSKEAYDRVLKQRKADRDRAKALEEENTRLKSEREAAEADKLAEQNKFKELYEKAELKRKELEDRLSGMSQAQVTSAKTSALVQELGVTRSEFLKFADLGAIQMNDDGTVESESLKAVANKFRESYPELIPAKTSAKLPNGAPAAGKPMPAKKVEEMSPAELRQAWAKLRTSQAK